MPFENTTVVLAFAALATLAAAPVKAQSGAAAERGLDGSLGGLEPLAARAGLAAGRALDGPEPARLERGGNQGVIRDLRAGVVEGNRTQARAREIAAWQQQIAVLAALASAQIRLDHAVGGDPGNTPTEPRTLSMEDLP